jgi:hypothetical protein
MGTTGDKATEKENRERRLRRNLCLALKFMNVAIQETFELVGSVENSLTY